MYFWNIKKLKAEFIQGEIQEKDLLKYLIAYTTLLSLSMIPLSNTTNQFDIFSAVLTIPISILGLLYVYTCNGGDTGNNFLGKYFAIGWVITIRILTIVIITGILYGIFAGIFKLNLSEETTLWETLIIVVVEIFYYWRVAVHIGDIANQSDNNEKV